MDNMTVGEVINYWKEDAVSIVKEEMNKRGIKKSVHGVFRIDIGISPRRATSRYDIDNYLKMPIDALERAELFKDDVAVVEIFATRLPLGSGVIMSVFKIKDRFIYEDKDKNKECFVTRPKRKKMTINEKIENKAHFKINVVVKSVCVQTKLSSGNADNIAGMVV